MLNEPSRGVRPFPRTLKMVVVEGNNLEKCALRFLIAIRISGTHVLRLIPIHLRYASFPSAIIEVSNGRRALVWCHQDQEEGRRTILCRVQEVRHREMALSLLLTEVLRHRLKLKYVSDLCMEVPC